MQLLHQSQVDCERDKLLIKTKKIILNNHKKLLLKSHDLNKYDIISPNSIYYEENKQYFNTTIKKIIKIKNSNIKDINLFINLLINALKYFSVKYELNHRKIIKAQKFVITFDELISLIRFTLESQRQLNNCIKNDLHNSKNLS